MDIEVKLIADELGKSLKNLAPAVQHELEAAVGNLAQATYAAMIAKVQSMGLDPKNRQAMLKGLKFENLGDATWLIYIDGEWANKLEEGFGAYNIKDVLLQSQKTVEVGSRAGQPWVRKNKKGKKYAAVPFDHHPSSGEKSQGLAQEINKMMGRNQAGSLQSITQLFVDANGKPIHGKISAHTDETTPKNLQGLVKYQHVHESGKVSSVYMTYRMVGEDSKGWVHPGHKGYQLFKEAETYVQSELRNILKTLL